jgi:hypothetical protein
MLLSSSSRRSLLAVVMSVVIWVVATACAAADIGQIKVAKGGVSIERGGQTLPGSVGMRLQTSDTIRTASDGSVGITMTDNSLLSTGPNTVLSLDRYDFDPTTNHGRFDSSLSKGALSVISGSIAKSAKDAMTVRTPYATLGVRGTDFVVSADE